VADFVGSANILDPEFSALHGGVRAWTSLRPESIRVWRVGSRPEGQRRVDGVVATAQYQGAVTRLTVDVNGTAINVAVPAGERAAEVGEKVTLSWRPDALHALDPG
jgi:putative spermidine/putrescine transport system ATP-binding protein